MSDFLEASHRQPSSLYQKLAKRCLQDLISDVSGVNSALLASGDGFEVASVIQQAGMDSGKIAAVSSSILSMIQSFTVEIKLVGCQSLILDAVNGKAIIMEVPHQLYPMVLVVLASDKVLLGHALHSIRHCSQRLIESSLN